MKERTSKLLLLVESIVLLVPVSMLTGVYAVTIVPRYMYGGIGRVSLEEHVISMLAVVGLIMQLCGWRIIAAFLSNGRRGIQAVPAIYIYAAVLGGVLVAASCLIVLIRMSGIELPKSVGPLSVNYLAAPALVPLAHVLIERVGSRGLRLDGQI